MKRAATIVLSAVALAAAGCGGGGDDAASAGSADSAGSAAEVGIGAGGGAGAGFGEGSGLEPSSTNADADADADAGGGSTLGESPSSARRPEGLPAYRRRCERLDVTGAWARVVYQARKEMTRGDAETVTAAVTINQTAPAAKILRRPGAVDEPGVIVSCRIQAQLSASKYEFEIDNTAWVERSLLGGETARWSWYVKPKIGGDQMLVLYVRPIVKVEEMGSTGPSPESSNVQQYETSVHVGVPWAEKPAETMTQVAATLKVAEGLVQAMTAFIVAVVALLAVVGVKRKRERKKASSSDARAAGPATA